MPESSAKSTSKTARVAAFVLLGLIGLLVVVQGSAPNNAPVTTIIDGEPAPAGSADPDSIAPIGSPPAADVSALLNGLTLGSEFQGWKVVNFFPTNDKVVWVELSKSGTFFSIGIGVRGMGKPPPPVQTDLYELGYGMVRPKGASISSDEMTKIALEIAARIREREREVPKPVGL